MASSSESDIRPCMVRVSFGTVVTHFTEILIKAVGVQTV